MTASRWQDEVAERFREAKLRRKRGEAFGRAGDASRAAAEFGAGAAVLDAAIALMLALPEWPSEQPEPAAEPNPEVDPTAEVAAIARELVEAYGTRGGMLRRLGDSRAALDSYRKGAELEERLVHQSTYNRVNAVKFALLSGAHSLDDLVTDIGTLEKLLTRQLAEQQELSDSGWAWADLGDCRALLGDVPGAERAYRAFVEKAGSSAPKVTLEVLRTICDELDEAGDAKAATVRGSLRNLEARLG